VFGDSQTGDKAHASESNSLGSTRLFQDRELGAKCFEIVYSVTGYGATGPPVPNYGRKHGILGGLPGARRNKPLAQMVLLLFGSNSSLWEKK
jgi:hypothetical protein